jgi:hypothetical protein
MKRELSLLAVMTWVAFSFTAAHAQDNGVPDTLYLEVYPGDDVVTTYPADVRFNLRVTNDIPNPYIDSIAGMVIPLDFTSSNPAANAVIPFSKNNMDVYPRPDLENSIFRHMPSMADPQERNFMMDYAEQMIDLQWDTRILDLGGGEHFWMSLVPTGMADQRFPGGSKVLVATMTFEVEDTTSICIDTCFAMIMRLAFSRSDAVTYIPRHFMPVCQLVTRPGVPPALSCPPDQQHSSDGHFSGLSFSGEDPDGIIVDVSSDFIGAGVENVTLVNLAGLGSASVTGEVEYDVSDHCQAGGTVTVAIRDDVGWKQECEFDVALSNSPPEFSLFHTWRALVGYTMGLWVSATDPDGDAVTEIELDAFWCEDDSLQPPVNPPTFDGENPGLFTWAPTGTETGTWIALFTASDPCGASYTRDISIEVGTLYCGDCNSDGEINLADVVYLIADLFKGGPPPDPVCKADANCSGYRDVGDVVVLINYLFKYGQAPCFECCP